MKEYLISIIVPIYNVNEYLNRCIKSIINQTYKKIEIILVDDGSTDNSGDICNKYALEDKRILVIHKKNEGLVKARKEGLERATGEYIGFVDGDDYIDTNMYQELFDNIEKTGADFVHSGYMNDQFGKISPDNIVIHLDDKNDREKILKQYVLDYTSDRYISPSIWSKLFKSELIKSSYKFVPDDQEVGEDVISLSECVLRSNKISMLNLAAYHYVKRKGSLSNMGNIEDLTWQPGFYKAMEAVLIRHECYKKEKRWLDNLFIYFVWCSLEKRVQYEFAMSQYQFEKIEKLFDQKIVLYGAGKVGRDFYSQISCYQRCNIVAWIDSNYQNISYQCMEVTDKEKLRELDYDYIVIAVKSERKAKEIKEMLIKEGIELVKIIWEKPKSICFETDKLDFSGN